MSKNLYTYIAPSYNPYENQAIEKSILNDIQANSICLYLWQNHRTVFIGKNQNVYNECNVELLNKDGGYLARRITGGGAVYHDLGNLNYSFIASNDVYDENQQIEVILDACKALGVVAQISGRNDLLVNGKKFSGQAYYHGSKASLQHGTLMIDVDKNTLVKYLIVNKQKLLDHKVKSVRSRVTNLKEICNEIDVNTIKAELLNSFSNYNEGQPEQFKINQQTVEKFRKEFLADSWRYNTKKELSHQVEGKFVWGYIKLEYTLDDTIISDCCIYSDAMEVEYLSNLASNLTNCDITNLSSEMFDVKYDKINQDVISLLKGV